MDSNVQNKRQAFLSPATFSTVTKAQTRGGESAVRGTNAARIILNVARIILNVARIRIFGTKNRTQHRIETKLRGEQVPGQ